MLVQHCTAGDVQRAGLHPVIDHRAKLRHLDQCRVRGVADGDVLLDGGKLLLRRIIVILHARDAAHYLREIERLDRDAGLFQQLLRVANRIERCRTSANRSEASVLQSANDAADP